jgi:hypothetical protein
VILEVDHIEPVSKGGTNDLLNLITSCRSCNRGKKDIKVSDTDALDKQREQMEELERRREQIRMMLKWRKSLDDLDNEISESIIKYIESKISGFKLSDQARANINNLSKKFSFKEILDAVDTSAQKHLTYFHGELDKSSVDEYVSKIGGILFTKNKSPIEQKVAYIKGIAKNRFGYFDPEKASIILQNYVKALQYYGWDENTILNDLENEVVPKTKEQKNWSQWKNLIEKWTDDIYDWIED